MRQPTRLTVRPQTLIAVRDVKVWFEVDEFDAAVDRARRLGARVIEEPHVNPAPQHREIWIQDPDGYVVVLASPDGEADEA